MLHYAYPRISPVLVKDLKTDSKKPLERKWSSPEIEYLASNTWIFSEKPEVDLFLKHGGRIITKACHKDF